MSGISGNIISGDRPSQKNNSLYSLLFDRNPVPMWIYERGSMRFLKVNDAAVEKYGYSRQEFLSMTIKDIRPVNEVSKLHVFISQHDLKYAPSGEWTHLTKDGRRLHVIITSEESIFDGKKARLVQALDITLQRQLEQSKDHLSTLNEKLIENLPDVFFLLDEQHRIIHWNKNLELVSGYETKDIRRAKAETFFTGEDQEKILQELSWLKTGERVMLNAQITNVNGQKIPARFSAVRFQANGKHFVTGVAHDLREITWLQKRTERQEKRFRETFEQSVFGLAFIDRSGRVLLVNRRLSNMLGYPKTDLEHLRIGDLTHPDDYSEELEIVAKLLKGQNKRVSYRKRFIRSDKSEFWAQIDISTVFTNTGEVDFFVATMQDINEKVELQSAYRNTYTLLNQTFESIGDAVFVLDSRERRILNVNRAACELLHYEREELIGSSIDIVYPDQAYSQRLNEEKGILEDRGEVRHDLRLRQKGGTPIQGRVTASKLMNGDKWTGNIVSAVRDVTRERDLQNELELSQERLLDAQRIAHLGHWSHDLKQNRLYWSDEVYRIFGVCKDFEVKLAGFLNAVHPDDRVEMDHYISGLAKGGSDKLEHRIVRPDGQIRYVLEHSEVHFDAEGEATWIVGTVQDITSQKHHEHELKQALREKEVMLMEMHHRVKNNMALVSALLYLQSTEVNQPDVIQLLEASQSRLKSIAGVHEELYRAERLTHIPASTVIRHALESLLGIPSDIDLQLHDVEVNINQAIPFALFLNELFFHLVHHCHIHLPNKISRIEVQERDNVLQFKLHLSGDNCFGVLEKFTRNLKHHHLVAYTLLQQLQGETELCNQKRTLALRFRLSEEKGSANALGGMVN